jgi:hypothetical protein
MDKRVHKVAPLAAVLVLVAHCCWPYLTGSGGAVAPTAVSRLPQLTTAWRTPALGIEPARDPFRAPAAVARPAAGDRRPRVAGTPTKDRGLDDAAKLFVLSATLIQGHERLARINGRLYHEGAQLQAAKPADESYVVARVEPDKVLLRRGDRMTELHYAAQQEPARMPKGSARGKP